MESGDAQEERSVFIKHASLTLLFAARVQEDHLVIRVFGVILGSVIMHHTRVVLRNPRIALVPQVQCVEALTGIDLTVTARTAHVTDAAGPGVRLQATKYVQAAEVASSS